MSARPQEWPILDIAAALRSQLDEERAKSSELAAERDALRSTLMGEAELAESQHEPHETRGSAWWRAAWREVSRHRSELLHRVQQLEGWSLEHGAEAMRLQTERDIARHEHGVAASMLDATQERVNDLEGEIVRLRERLSESVGGRDVD